MILRPRVVLKANSQSGSQDQLVQEARSSWESQQDAESYGETRSNTADYRAPGISISTVKLQRMHGDKITSQNLSRCSKKHRHKEQFLEGMSQKQEINSFSEESQKLLEDMDQTEIFELCDNSAKLQCLDCNPFTEIGIMYCSCGRNLKYKRSLTTTQKANCDCTSIPGFVIMMNSSRGPKDGQSERQIMFFKAKEMLNKARQEKHGSHPMILSKRNEQEGYRRSLAEHSIGEKEIMLYDRIALERHDHTATRAERLQNAKHWVLRLNADGHQRPLRQRQEFADALKQCLKNARCSLGGDGTNSDIDTSTASTASTTKSAIRRRRKLRLLCRSQDWMVVLQRATGKPSGSIFIFIFNFAVADFAIANELELMATYII